MAKKRWLVQYLRPDGWETLIDFATKDEAEKQKAEQLKHYPHSQYRVHREGRK